MSFETMESQRKGVTDSITAKFGKVIDKANEQAGTKTKNDFDKRMLGGRVALEYAVLATAREKNVASEVVAASLHGTTPAQQAMLLKEGAAALGRTFSVEPDVLVNIYAGKLVDVEMPRGLGSTPEIDKMVDTCRNLVTEITRDEYANRGKFSVGSYERDTFVALKSDGIVAPAKSELASRLAFLESAIDSGASAGKISPENAGFLKQRIESQVFQPRPPESIHFSKEFLKFYETRGAEMRKEAMQEVRQVIKNQPVTDLAARLKIVVGQQPGKEQNAAPSGAKPPSDQRSNKQLER